MGQTAEPEAIAHACLDFVLEVHRASGPSPAVELALAPIRSLADKAQAVQMMACAFVVSHRVVHARMLSQGLTAPSVIAEIFSEFARQTAPEVPAACEELVRSIGGVAAIPNQTALANAAHYELASFEVLARGIDSLIDGMLLYGSGAESGFEDCVVTLRAKVPDMADEFLAAYRRWN